MNMRKSLRKITKTHQQEPTLNPGAALGPEVKARIGHQLRLMYDEVANQGVPDRFADPAGFALQPPFSGPC